MRPVTSSIAASSQLSWDDELLPAVDYRIPGGLSWRELEITLSAAAPTGHMVGLEITILNPTLERDEEEEVRQAACPSMVTPMHEWPASEGHAPIHPGTDEGRRDRSLRWR